MKNSTKSFLEYIHQLCWIIPAFFVMFYLSENNAKSLEHHKSKGDYRIDSTHVVVLPCELPAYLDGFENDTLHVSHCIAPGRKISISGVVSDVKKNSQVRSDTLWGIDSLSYFFNKKKLNVYSYARISHDLYDCHDSLLSSKLVFIYPVDFFQKFN